MIGFAIAPMENGRQVINVFKDGNHVGFLRSNQRFTVRGERALSRRNWHFFTFRRNSPACGLGDDLECAKDYVRQCLGEKCDS